MEKRKLTREEIIRYLEKSRELLEGDLLEVEDPADLSGKAEQSSSQKTEDTEEE